MTDNHANGLENRQGRKSFEGSNPSPSANINDIPILSALRIARNLREQKRSRAARKTAQQPGASVAPPEIATDTPGGLITDEQVEAACEEWFGATWPYKADGGEWGQRQRESMRATLEKAARVGVQNIEVKLMRRPFLPRLWRLYTHYRRVGLGPCAAMRAAFTIARV